MRMFLSLTLAVAAVLAWWAGWRVRNRRLLSLASQLPGPPALPVLGNALHFMVPSEELTNVIGKLIQEYGDVWRFWLGPDLNILVNNPDDVKNILSSSKASIKGPQYKFMAVFLGDGLLSGSGPTWRMARKIATPAIGWRAVGSHEEVFNRETDVTLERLRSKVGEETFDMYDHIITATTYAVCQALMGLTREQTLNLPHLDFIIKDSSEVMLNLFTRMSQWHLQIEPFYRLTKYYQKQTKFIKKMLEMADVIVKHRLKALEAMDNERKMEILNAKDDNKRNTELSVIDRLVLSNQISYDKILRQIFALFSESQEAAAKIVCFILQMMAYHPEYQEKLYAEIKEVFGDSDRDVTDDDIKEMTYLDMVLKEVLRLFPIGVMLQRTISDEFKISAATLPAGCSVIIPIFHLHRDKRYWPDPNTFDPERFSPENSMLRPTGCYVPFSLGPMDCIGRHFAIKLVKTMSVKILREFRITSPETFSDMRLQLAIAVSSINGYPTQLHPRKH